MLSLFCFCRVLVSDYAQVKSVEPINRDFVVLYSNIVQMLTKNEFILFSVCQYILRFPCLFSNFGYELAYTRFQNSLQFYNAQLFPIILIFFSFAVVRIEMTFLHT